MNLQGAFVAACEQEILALKPGNVHVHAAGHRMTVQDFRRSSHATAPALCERGAPLGARILGAVMATRAAVGQNTNLGIILLSAPIIMAAESGDCSPAGVGAVLDATTTQDTADVFQAIMLASPAGLGDAPDQDVRGPATAPLRRVMWQAADRDRIAAQYANGFDDVFDLGLSAYRTARTRWGDPLWATVVAYLRFLATGPDSHIIRKFDAETADLVQTEAIVAERALLAASSPAEEAASLLAWDAHLKRRGINPGTSADLTVATLLADACGSNLPRPARND